MNADLHTGLKLSALDIGYAKGYAVLQNINLHLNAGTVTALLANNGVGKSTLLKTIAGYIVPLNGEVNINGMAINVMSRSFLAKKLSIVLTEKPQLPGFTVFEAVSLGRYPYTNIFGNLTENDLAIVHSSMEKCGIKDFSLKNCSELSDGELQKVMIARALAQQTDVILLDEPSAYLDYTSKRNLFNLLKNIAEQEQKIVLVSSHDIDTVCEFAHDVFIIKRSREYSFLKAHEIKGQNYVELLS